MGGSAVNMREEIDALRRAILQDATELGRREVEQAREWVAQQQEAAAQAAEEERERILHDAEREAEALSRRIWSAGELEAKRRLLEVRERLVREVLARALADLREPGETDERRETLRRLLLEAAREIGGGCLTVEVAASDVELLTGEFLAEVRERLAMDGVSAELSPAGKPAEIAGGVIVRRDGGRVVVDNSFEARLRRQEADLRSGIWRILSGGKL